MKKLKMWTKVMGKICRYKYVEWNTLKRLFAIIMAAVLVTGCGKENANAFKGIEKESATDSYIDFENLTKANEDIFGWIYVPEAGIDYPLVQSSDGDDLFYQTHNASKEADSKGAVYIEAANLKDMCDFNEVVHASCQKDGTMFGNLSKFLDKTFFDNTKYIYVYMDGNALIYYVFAAYVRDDNRLLEQYDFSYASGCQGFIDEIYGQKSMGTQIRSGWENGLTPDHFIITLTTSDPDMPGKQIVVIGCLVGDVAGKIDRFVDYSDPESD